MLFFGVIGILFGTSSFECHDLQQYSDTGHFGSNYTIQYTFNLHPPFKVKTTYKGINAPFDLFGSTAVLQVFRVM